MIIDPLGNIPIERGGTGATTIEEVKEKLGVNYTVLYSNSGGSSASSFKLSDNYTNYTYIEVYYSGYCYANSYGSPRWGGTSDSLSCAKFWCGASPSVTLLAIGINDDITNLDVTICSAQLSFSGATATYDFGRAIYFDPEKDAKGGNGAIYPYIYRIVGYK